MQHARSCFALAEAQMRRFKPGTALRRQRARPMHLRGRTAAVRGMAGRTWVKCLPPVTALPVAQAFFAASLPGVFGFCGFSGFNCFSGFTSAMDDGCGGGNAPHGFVASSPDGEGCVIAGAGADCGCAADGGAWRR